MRARMPRGCWVPFSVVFGLAALGVPRVARAEEGARGEPRGPQPPPTLLWIATQLIPSPMFLVAERRVSAAFAWQITPLLVQYHARPRVSPVRFFVVEPIVRNSGSSELFVAPEVVPGRGDDRNPLGVAIGVRSTFPLWENGDGLAASLAVAYVTVQGDQSARVEAGFDTLFGVFGLHASYAPTLFGGTTALTLRVRYF
jgi:hypothetical protein